MDNAYDMGRKRGQEESRKEIERLKNIIRKNLKDITDINYLTDGIVADMQQALKEE